MVNLLMDLPELPQIKSRFFCSCVYVLLTTAAGACTELNFKPKITFLVVAKRHHLRYVVRMEELLELNYRRFFNGENNCEPGTVIEPDIVHPTEFDFYLQSHSGFPRLTNRSALYSVGRTSSLLIGFLTDDSKVLHDVSCSLFPYNLHQTLYACRKIISRELFVHSFHYLTFRVR